ncbi:PREDICTED: uncharacterized protein LOC106815352, partial [Priapulus caudatus]|uniref:Uncharacterized protein LOC106815352 n=1 Tax=Priapulus caudatus TaxID=37621 RepID=A0ABM1ESW6_PRICU
CHSGCEQVEAMGWESLPDILLEDIFAMVNIKSRYRASLVCRHWYRAFYAPRAWDTFVLEDDMLCTRKFLIHTGWNYFINQYKVQMLLNRIAHNWKRLVIQPMNSFYNMYEFVSITSGWIGACNERGIENPLPQLRVFKFRFNCCDTSILGGHSTLGTGGKFLEELCFLLRRFVGLQELELQHLLLEKRDASTLLDDTLANSGDTLRTLRVIDCAKVPHPFLHVGLFFNLRKLIISPNHVDEDVVHLLGFTRVRLVVLYQDAYTCQCPPVAWDAWKSLSRQAPRLRIEMTLVGRSRTEMVLQPRAAVRTILYASRYSVLRIDTLMFIVENYARTLEVFGHQLLPRVHRPKSFHDRADSGLVLLARTCTRLHTLIVRERVSTATLLLIASYGESLEHFLVRRNAVILRSDWPPNPMWTDDYYAWLKESSRSYDAVEREVSVKLRRPWKMMTDDEFKWINLINA